MNKHKQAEKILNDLSKELIADKEKGLIIPTTKGSKDNPEGFLDVEKFNELEQVKRTIEKLKAIGIKNSNELSDLGFMCGFMCIRY